MKNVRTLSPIVLAAIAGTAAAQPVAFTLWSFNSQPTGQTINNPAPTIGQGSAIPLGMTNNYTYSTSPVRVGSFTTCDITSAGASGDTASVPNNCWRVRGSFANTLATAGIGWSIFAPQYTQGAEFAVSSVNYSGIVFTFDWFTTNQGVRNMQVQYSVNGGSTWTNTGPILNSATNGWINNVTVDLSAIAAANDNPNLRVRMVSVYDPTYTGPGAPTYTGASGGQYNNSSGNWRFDRVTFTGTPIRSIGPSIVAPAVTPPAVCNSGGQLTFSVQVVGGASPASTGLNVVANLAPLGLSATQAMSDSGTNGDIFAGDGIYTYQATIPGGRPLAPVSIAVTVTDAQARSANTSIPVIVGDCSTTSASRIVISETFGGGGNLGALPSEDAPFDADYVELFNRSTQTVSLDGWSVQYASAGSSSGFNNAGDRVLLSGNIRPGQSLLVRMSDPVPGFSPLPTPDFAQTKGFGGMGNTGGRVALVRASGLIGTDYTNANIEDFVGYGSAAANFEGVSPAPTPSPANATANLRKLSGAQDTNQNFNDFAIGFPAPANRSSGGFLAGYPSTDIAAACTGTPVLLKVTVVPGASSTGITVNADVSDIAGLPSTVQLLDNGANGDAQANDGIYSRSYTVPPAAAQGVRTIGFTVADAQGGSDTSRVTFAVATCSDSGAPVVISQVYGGGGNDFSGFNGDFAEIFNRSGFPIDLTGWSFQSARVSDQGFDNRIAFLSGVINPGEYRLIVTNQLAPTGAVLPAADFTPATLFGMENNSGRVVLVSSTDLVGTDYTRPDVVDHVGYGTDSPSFEGVAAAPTASNIEVVVRKQGGCQDTNQNAVDFNSVLALALPRNSATPASICPGVNVCGCAADYNSDGGVDGGDVEAFFGGWENAEPCADVNQDGGVDGGDVEAFFLVWEAGGCN
jgi:hypothetical protein